MSEGTKQVIFEVGIHVKGVKRKCRKSERHYFSVTKIPYDENATLDQVRDVVKAFLETNMKSVEGRPIVKFSRVEIGEHFRTMELFDKRNKEFVLESSLENALN
jgi:hypothetical protein